MSHHSQNLRFTQSKQFHHSLPGNSFFWPEKTCKNTVIRWNATRNPTNQSSKQKKKKKKHSGIASGISRWTTHHPPSESHILPVKDLTSWIRFVIHRWRRSHSARNLFNYQVNRRNAPNRVHYPFRPIIPVPRAGQYCSAASQRREI